MRPTRTAVILFCLGGLLAILPAAVAPGLWVYWLVFVFLSTGLLGADYILRQPIDRLSVKLDGPEQLLLGVKHRGDLVFVNPTRRPCTVRLRVDLSTNLQEIPEARRRQLPAGTSRVNIDLCARRRGRVALRHVWLEGAGPLGLMACLRRIPLGADLPVVPNLKAVSDQTTQLLSTKSRLAGAQVERLSGDGSEFDHLREYVPGLDIRNIDWKASARHAKMLCRHMRAERNRQVLIAVDAGRLMGEPIEGLPKVDHAIHSGLMLAFVSLLVGDKVGLAAFDDRLRHYCSPLSGREAFGKLSRVATQFDYSHQETNFTLGLMEIARRQVRRSLVVVLTDFVDTITAELMVENLARLSRKHLVVFVALQDAQLGREAQRRPERLLDLHRAVVAHRLLRERKMVIRELQRMGIVCIDSPPSDVSARLVARYLEIKKREAF
jgi:uncharacterized protein (DUF58 family)